MRTVATEFAELMAGFGISTCFQLSGGMIAFLADAINSHPEINLFNLKHEQAVGFAAEGSARLTGHPSVALATSGPGATNLITAIASCYFDSVPVLFVTGQVPSTEIKKNPTQRQNGFQELDIVSLVQPVVKYAARITAPDQIYEEFMLAFKATISGRPGPALLDIPIDIQQMPPRSPAFAPSYYLEKRTQSPDEKVRAQFAVNKMKEELSESTSPLVIAGGGIRLAGAEGLLLEFINKSSIPMVWSLMAKDVVASSHPLNLGMLGSYGHRWANSAVSQADLLIVLGSRLDERQTGPDVHSFGSGRRIFRVDIDGSELSGRVEADISIEMNVADFLMEAASRVEDQGISTLVEDSAKLKAAYPLVKEQKISESFSPEKIMKLVSLNENTARAFVVDVGQHQMWAAQSLEIDERQRFMTSGGHGAMGFSLPAAIGAAISSAARIVVIVGDGSAQVCIAELETIKHLSLDISIYVINNQQHGMVAQFQIENLESRFVGTAWGYSAPNFASLAAAYGIPSGRVSSESELSDLVQCLNAKDPKGPRLIELMVDSDFLALPKLSSRR